MITSLRSLANERQRRREARIRQLEQERDARESVIFTRIPELRWIKDVQTDIGLDLARIMLKVPTKFGKSFEELKRWSLQLSAQRNDLLQNQGIDPLDLEIRWDCPVCKNTGWLEPEPAGDDTVLPPRKCHCLVQEELNDLYRASGLSGSLRDQTFERFDLSVYPPDDQEYMANVMKACKRFAEGLAAGTQTESILLSGDVGRGKTFLLTAIANVSVAAKRTVVYFTLSEFIDMARLHKLDDDEEYRENLQRLLDADLVVLDDLGSEKVTDFVAQELFNLVNHRTNRRLPMAVSTNLTPDEFESYYGDRLASRLLYGFRGFHLRGNDVRRVLKIRRVQS